MFHKKLTKKSKTTKKNKTIKLISNLPFNVTNIVNNINKTFTNLKDKLILPEEEEKPDVVVEKRKFKTKQKDVGWDCSYTKDNFKEKPIFETEMFCIYNKKNPIAIVRHIPKLSKAEKGLYLKVFDYIKDLPLLAIERDIETYFREYCEDHSLIVEKDQKEYILRMLLYEVTGFGPLTTLLQDKDNIEELTIVGLGKEYPVYIYVSKFGWVPTNIYFTNSDYVKELINRMSRIIGRRLTLNQPLMNASLPDGSRLNAIIPPISNEFPVATLRRFRYNPLTPLDLIEYNTFSKEIAAFLWLVLQTDSNVLIVGNTGSGKTTTLNAVFSFVPKTERIIVAEETPEVNIPHKHKVRLRIDQNIGITMNDLIVSTLRMRPDRLIVGEIRTAEEVKSFLDTILAGQGKGSFATFHGLSAKDAIQRLIKLGMLEQDLNALDLIIVQRRWNIYDLKNNSKKEIRKIVSISELKDAKPKEIFSYDFSKEKWHFKAPERMKEKIEIAFGSTFDKLYKETIKKFDNLLKENKKKHLDFEEFFERVALQ